MWELPNETFFSKLYMPKSDNQTINFCDALARNASTFYDNFMGERKPLYSYVRPKSEEKIKMFSRRPTTGSASSIKVELKNQNEGLRLDR